jgi:hypothetical protein
VCDVTVNFCCFFLTAGLFNVGNKLLVSLDLLFAIRNQIKLGEDPRVSVSVVLKSVQEQTGKGHLPPSPRFSA